MKKIINLIICMLLIATAVQAVTTQDNHTNEYGKTQDSISFNQIDWYYQGTPLFINSLWGKIEIIATPDSAFWYMNVVADAGYGPAWILQNYPIFPQSYHLPNEQAIFFDIGDLGYHQGMDLQGLYAIISFERNPLQTPPQGQYNTYPVFSSVRDAWGHTTDPPQPVETPPGHIVNLPVDIKIKHLNTTALTVQEAPNNCITGAYARSIKWLDNVYDLPGLPPGKTAQDVYDDLNKSGVGHGSGQGLNEQQMLEKKAAYLKGLDPRAVTKFVDLTGWMNDSVAGCTEEKPANLKDWLQNELKTEDVEMCYDHHCIMIAGLYTQGNKTFLEYRDDEKQGNNSAGDTGEKDGELTHDGVGWKFNGFQVDYLVSESINDSPATPTIDGSTSGKPSVNYDYNFVATDPNEDDVFLFVEWGDGTNTGWLGPYASGAEVTVNHTWTKKGTYVIKAKAKDMYGAESGWGTLSVTMPYSYNLPFMQFWIKLFERFPNAFPILRHLLRY